MARSSETHAYWSTPQSEGLPPIGAVTLEGGGVSFTLWAPKCESVTLLIEGAPPREIPMRREHGGYFSAIVEGAEGARYLYRLDCGAERPDPASRYQPEGVHGPSQAIPREFDWRAREWKGLPLEQYVLYELHIGTFTDEGTFEAAIRQLPRLADLGITAIEIMPVAQFPGDRNWGYDGAYPFAVQNSYGGPEGLRRLVDEAHGQGLAVVLDVVYNHLGPEGSYLGDFGHYFTDRYHTPWGLAINMDGPHSDEVRRFFIENALHWVTEFRIDALRLDAVHAITDTSAVPFLSELAAAVHHQAEALGRTILLIPESDANDARLVRPRAAGGYGLDAQWTDGFHHALVALVTGERMGYYADYGELRHVAKAYRDGYVYSGQYSHYRQRRHGSSSEGIESRQFVVFSQNHDQTGNRMLGERLTARADFETLKLVAATVLLSPFTPLLFMGEEYAEPAPFQYFVSHSDPDLVNAVRNGRRAEFAAFASRGEFPDPQAEATFLRSKISPDLRFSRHHAVIHEFYRELLRLRRSVAFSGRSEMHLVELEEEQVLAVKRPQSLVLLNLGKRDAVIAPESLDGAACRWRLALDSASVHWDGPGSTAPEELDLHSALLPFRTARRSVQVYLREDEA